MIPVEEQLEPATFDAQVRAKGAVFLAKNPKPKLWGKHTYWTDALGDLCIAYKRVCAYSAHIIKPVEGSPTVDHFKAKSTHPDLAYQWTNYRLACGTCNRLKGVLDDGDGIIDPFRLEPHWFHLDLSSRELAPHPHLTEMQAKQVLYNIDRFRLNDRDHRDNREEILHMFCKYQDFNILQRNAPFIADELRYHDLIDENLCPILTPGSPLLLYLKSSLFEN